MTRLARCLFLVLALFAVGCSSELDPLPDDVRAAWEQYREKPDRNSFHNFMQLNRTAAMEHPYDDDARGVLHQLLALEAQSEQAAGQGDLATAQSVVTRIDEIVEGGVVDVYDEVVPGARERLLAARERVDALLR